MRPLILLRPSAGCPARQGTGGPDRGLAGAGRGGAPSDDDGALAHPSAPPVITRAGSRRGERVVAGLAQAARPADDLAGFGQGSALAALAVLHRRVAAVAGGAG